jgi:hypothetical protein
MQAFRRSHSTIAPLHHCTRTYISSFRGSTQAVEKQSGGHIGYASCKYRATSYCLGLSRRCRACRDSRSNSNWAQLSLLSRPRFCEEDTPCIIEAGRDTHHVRVQAGRLASDLSSTGLISFHHCSVFSIMSCDGDIPRTLDRYQGPRWNRYVCAT